MYLQKKTEEVVSQFDHRDLNTTPPFDHALNPTSENIARYFFDELKKHMPRRYNYHPLRLVKPGSTRQNIQKHNEVLALS
jgi:6-pyruvoyl-tetrahydropterin synthase